jgi:hypothetical protein
MELKRKNGKTEAENQAWQSVKFSEISENQ